jgi:hypothetical protein
MDKPNESTHRPTEPIHGPHHRSPDPHRCHVRSMLEAAHSPDLPAACHIRPPRERIRPPVADLATMGVDPLGRHRRRLWRLSGSRSAWSSSSTSDPGAAPHRPHATSERGRVELPELMMMHVTTSVDKDGNGDPRPDTRWVFTPLGYQYGVKLVPMGT